MVVVCAATAQTPPIRGIAVGDINLYGFRKVSASRVLATVDLKPGAPLPPSKGDMEDEIEKIPGVVVAQVEAVCCEGTQATVFIGIEERGAPHAAFRSPPAGNATLPEELADTYHQYLAAVERAAGRGNTTEDLTAGHSQMDDPQARVIQDKFILFAADHLELLRDVLRNASEAEQRAIAATVIGYADDKKKIVDDLQYALQDPDASVRANATRSLMAVAVFASKQPESGIRIVPTWLVEMLNSVVLSDRLEATKALLILTDGEAPSVLQQIRERALPSLAEMARWKTPRYALPPFLLAGRVAGVPDAQVRLAWDKQDREAVIAKALRQPKELH